MTFVKALTLMIGILLQAVAVAAQFQEDWLRTKTVRPQITISRIKSSLPSSWLRLAFVGGWEAVINDTTRIPG